MTVQIDIEGNEKKYLHKFADFTDKRVLEIGCGEGRLTWKYAHASSLTIGLDTDHDALRVASIDSSHNLKDKVFFVHAQAQAMPFPNESFDIVLLAWSLCCIEPEGKLDALNEIRRVLVPNGIAIDIRSIVDSWEIEVASAREVRTTGRVSDTSFGLEHDEGANKAVTQAEKNGWYIRDESEFFSYSYSWDTPSEMEETIGEDWQDFIVLDEEAQKSTRSAWALGDADSRVRMNVKMLISRWLVSKE